MIANNNKLSFVVDTYTIKNNKTDKNVSTEVFMILNQIHEIFIEIIKKYHQQNVIILLHCIKVFYLFLEVNL